MTKSLWVPLSKRPMLAALFLVTLTLVGCKAKVTSFTFLNSTSGAVDFTATNITFGTLTHTNLQPLASATDTFPCRKPGAFTDPMTVTVTGTDCNGPWTVSSNPFPVCQGGQYTSTITSNDDGTNITYTLTVTAYNPKTGATTTLSTTTATTESCDIIN